MKTPLRSLDCLGRRQFAERLARTSLGLSLLPFADQAIAATQGRAKHIIYLMMSGGMSHLDTFDPKPGAETQGDTRTVDTSVPGVKFSSYLPELADRFDDLAVIRSLSQKTGAHEGASYWIQAGHQSSPSVQHPSIGSLAQKILGKSHPQLPDTVYIGSGGQPDGGFLGPAFAPLPVVDPEKGLPDSQPPVDSRRASRRLDALEAMNQPFLRKFSASNVQAYAEYYEDALSLIQGKDLEVFDISKEPSSKRNAYGSGRLGQGLLLARRLVESGVRFVRVTHGGWDMHDGLWDRIERTTAPLDQGLSALIDDLKSIGKFEETLIVLTTEFGRTPNINANKGRDHHPRCFSSVLAGGGIQGGAVYGVTDQNGYAVSEDPCSIEDFNATIFSAVGIRPGHRLHKPGGRPYLVANDGKAIDSLL